ncbi:MAG TPA: hypothetical protein VIX14_07910 [Terriglobales bacterium]
MLIVLLDTFQWGGLTTNGSIAVVKAGPLIKIHATDHRLRQIAAANDCVSDLGVAVNDGRIDCVEMLLAKGASPNTFFYRYPLIELAIDQAWKKRDDAEQYRKFFGSPGPWYALAPT